MPILSKGLVEGRESKPSLLDSATIYHLNVNDIALNQDQPRKSFDQTALQELADSIKQHGVIQPIIVTKQGLHYRLVAGERRWRASRLAGLLTIPAIVRELSDRDVMQQALIENIQREDLNPIEEALAYQRLLQDYKLTQEQLAQVVGKSRSTVANSLRLNQLASEVQNLLNEGEITSGHARAILSVGTARIQTAFARVIVDEGLSVRMAERRSKTFAEEYETLKQKAEQRMHHSQEINGEKDISDPQSAVDSQRIRIERVISERLGRKVRMDWGENSGKVVLSFDGTHDLEMLLTDLGIDLNELG